MALKWQKYFKVVLSILICEFAGLIGGIFTNQAIPDWYDSLNKPPLNPPNWVFGPVWTILYLLMGISLYLVWKKGTKKSENKAALIAFGIQLALNVLWSIVFFGFRSILGGLVVIILLWISILVTIIKFYSISKTASFLLLPYILWVSFAYYLNGYIWKLNR